MPPPFRVAFVPGVTPDRWATRFRERVRRPLELVPVAEEDQERVVRDRDVDMVLARLPVDRDGLHCVRLYEELPVVVAAADHLVSVVEDVTTEDLADEQLVLPERSGWCPPTEQRPWPPMDAAQAVAVAASGAGVVVLPMAVARLHHRRDVVHRPVTDLPTTAVGLVWLVEHDPPEVQTFVGVVRGRTARSSRG